MIKRTKGKKQDDTPIAPHKNRHENRPQKSNVKETIDGFFWVLVLVRGVSAVWNNIYDCDESFNYWEPLHLFLYGSGLQTWEYSPDYALRSYFYVVIHAVPGFILKQLTENKLLIFFGIRAFISLFTVSAEYTLYKALRRRSERVARFFLLINTFSVGMFISSSAFLPSSFSMMMNMFIIAFYLSEQWFLAILSTCISAFVGWPFAAIFGIPIAIDMLLLRDNKHRINFITFSIFSATLVGGLMLGFDSFYYGKLVFAPLNIVLYNVISGHGPELYGVEPVSYYVKNLALNWNIANVFALLALPFVFYNNVLKKTSTFILLYVTFCAWIAIFFLTPHKEERFLFPLYPMISVFMALSLNTLQTIIKERRLFRVQIGHILVVLFTLCSLVRLMGLHIHYSGSFNLYRSMNDHFNEDRGTFNFCDRKNTALRVCVGKEWHRFPSSFFLPEKLVDLKGCSVTTELSFLRSEFRGLLPKPFTHGSLREITSAIPSTMNDANQEETDRYVELNTCDYIIDLERPTSTELEPDFGKTRGFEAVRSHRYLLTESCPRLRPIYLPIIDERVCRYVNYTLYRRV